MVGRKKSVTKRKKKLEEEIKKILSGPQKMYMSIFVPLFLKEYSEMWYARAIKENGRRRSDLFLFLSMQLHTLNGYLYLFLYVF